VQAFAGSRSAHGGVRRAGAEARNPSPVALRKVSGEPTDRAGGAVRHEARLGTALGTPRVVRYFRRRSRRRYKYNGGGAAGWVGEIVCGGGVYDGLGLDFRAVVEGGRSVGGGILLCYWRGE